MKCPYVFAMTLISATFGQSLHKTKDVVSDCLDMNLNEQVIRLKRFPQQNQTGTEICLNVEFYDTTECVSLKLSQVYSIPGYT